MNENNNNDNKCIICLDNNWHTPLYKFKDLFKNHCNCEYYIHNKCLLDWCNDENTIKSCFICRKPFTILQISNINTQYMNKVNNCIFIILILLLLGFVFGIVYVLYNIQ